MTIVQRSLLRLRYEHACVTLRALRDEIASTSQWLASARAHVERKQFEVERLRHDLDALQKRKATLPTNAGYALQSTGYTGAAKFGYVTHVGELNGWAQTGATLMSWLSSYQGNAWRDIAKWSQLESIRGSIAWNTASPANSTNATWRISDALTQGSGVRTPVLLLAYGNRLYGTGAAPAGSLQGMVYDADSRSGYAAFCKFVVNKTKDRCGRFEIWNEWHGGGGDAAHQDSTHPERQTNANYTAMLQAAYASIKAEFPSAIVVAGAMSDPNPASCPGRLAGMLATDWQSYADAFSIHPYETAPNTNSYPEVGYAKSIESIALIQASKPNCPIYITEVGTSNQSTISSVAEKAKFSTRHPFLMRSLPGVELCTFYALRDDGADGSYQNSFGYMNNNTTDKTLLSDVMRAVMPIVQTTNTAKCYLSGTVYAVSLGMQDTTKRLAIWCHNGSGTATASVTIYVTAANQGTLSILAPGTGTTTAPLAAGTNGIALNLTEAALVLSANVSIAFPGIPPT